jgi:two-component system response regulator YesN
MLKVMVVDDENIVIESIKYIVSKNFENVVVADTARSGREAIEKAETVRPDLVFMDIKMPGINGIEAIKEIKAANPNVRFVIISACEQFEYAKEAVSMGVVEYLMKPVNRTRIIEIIRQAERALDESRERRKRELELREKFERVLPVLEHGFIFSILLYEDYNDEIENYKRILDVNEEAGYVMTIEFGGGNASGNPENVIGSSVFSQKIYPQIVDIVKDRLRCIMGPVMLNRIIIYVPTPSPGDGYSDRVEAVAAAEYIAGKISKRADIQFRIGIGGIKDGSENILASFTESLRALKYAGEKEIMHIHDITEEGAKLQSFSAVREKQLIDRAAMGVTAECMAIFNQMFDELAAAYGNSVEDIKGGLLEPVVVLHRLALDYGLERTEIFKGQNYLREFLALNDPLHVKGWCRDRIELVTTGIKAARDRRCNNLITKAREYIESNYNKDLTLEDVSREVGLSPHYFSRFFKEETGENFIDYLTNIRIREAKNLLERENLSIKEVCFKVGYNDPNYFSRIFKRITGISPSEFRT